VLAALLVTTTLALAPASAPASSSVLSVQGGEWHGSAIVWNREGGLLLTALHVVEDMPLVEVRLPDGARATARIVDRDPMLDLALLEVDARDAQSLPAPLPIAAAGPRPGAPVRLAGCPALACGAVDAEVAVPLRAFAGSRYLELLGEARPGSSGGAVLDADGALLGIVDLALPGPRAVALAVPIERAAARFPRLPAAPAASAAVAGVAPARALATTAQ
jgi:S1-C subfamily serine protease